MLFRSLASLCSPGGRRPRSPTARNCSPSGSQKTYFCFECIIPSWGFDGSGAIARRSPCLTSRRRLSPGCARHWRLRETKESTRTDKRCGLWLDRPTFILKHAIVSEIRAARPGTVGLLPIGVI